MTNMLHYPSASKRKQYLQDIEHLPLNKMVYASIGENKTVLSVGCNRGSLELELKKQGNTVYAIDIDKVAIEQARKYLDGTYIIDISVAQELPFKEGFFDVIIFADVLEHLIDPTKPLQLVKKYLKEDGYIVVSLPNVANFAVRLQLLFGSFRYTNGGILDKTHLRFFTLLTTQKLFKTQGYAIIDIHYNTSIVNIAYNYFKHFFHMSAPKNSTDVSTVWLNKRENNYSSSIKKSLVYSFKKFIEAIDRILTAFFPSLFAYQFVFVAKKKYSRNP